jgi:uncharacterized protein YycO
MKLRKGDLIISNARSFIGEIIKIFTNGQYSHVALHIKDGFCIDSSWGGVQLKHISQFPSYHVYRHTKFSRSQMDTVIKWLISKIGKGYDFLGLFGIALAILKIKEGNDLDNKHRYWCSELIADAFHYAKIPIKVPKGTPFVSPQQLADLPNMRRIKK